MKSLIVLVIGLLAVGCKTAEQKEALRDSVIGEYGLELGRYVLLKSGTFLVYHRDQSPHTGEWKIVNGKLHIISPLGRTTVWRINKDKSITGKLKASNRVHTVHKIK